MPRVDLEGNFLRDVKVLARELTRNCFRFCGKTDGPAGSLVAECDTALFFATLQTSTSVKTVRPTVSTTVLTSMAHFNVLAIQDTCYKRMELTAQVRRASEMLASSQIIVNRQTRKIITSGTV